MDLFDVDESTIAPGSPATIEALGSGGGTGAGASPGSSPGASPQASGGTGAGGGAVAERPTTRDELWVPIVLIVLLVLCVEWTLYHRDGLVRIRRSLAGRLGRGARGTA